MNFQNLKKYRQDGMIITEKMDLGKLIQKGLPISRIIKISWEDANNNTITINADGGSTISPTILPGRNYILISKHFNGEWQEKILNPDGSIRYVVPDNYEINGKIIKGYRNGITFYDYGRDNMFSVIFSPIYENNLCTGQYRLDIDAETGNVIKVMPVRW